MTNCYSINVSSTNKSCHDQNIEITTSIETKEIQNNSLVYLLLEQEKLSFKVSNLFRINRIKTDYLFKLWPIVDVVKH
jgi:hypothetical protein